MSKLTMAMAFAVSMIALGGCASKAETLGTAGGAAVGYGATGGSTLGTLGGAAVGYGAGKVYDDKHKDQ